MPAPRQEDLAVAREMARRIAAAAGDRVERILLYGSRARGMAHRRSDYDLLVVETRRIDPFPEEERLTDALEDLGIWADVRVVSARSFHRTRDLVGYLSYAAAYDGITLYRRGEVDEGVASVA